MPEERVLLPRLLLVFEKSRMQSVGQEAKAFESQKKRPGFPGRLGDSWPGGVAAPPRNAGRAAARPYRSSNYFFFAVFACASLPARPARRPGGRRHAERRAAHVGQAEAMAELHGVRVATVFAADAQLDARTGLAALLHRDLHQLADAGLVDRGERILLDDFQLLVRPAGTSRNRRGSCPGRSASGRSCRS